MGLNPFWHDEAFFAATVRDGIWKQELVPHLIAYLFNLDTDLKLRCISALFGTLSIPAIYFVLKENKWIGVALVAFNPLFIFWSQLIRPYATAGFFVILGWKYWWSYIPALMTTPFSIFGLRLLDQKKWLLPAIIILGILFFLFRPDSTRFVSSFNTGVFHFSRFWYIPLVSLILYFCDYLIPYSKKHAHLTTRFYIIITIIVTTYFFFSISNILSNKSFQDDGVNLFWYRSECKISNWKEIGKVDFATEQYAAQWYGGSKCERFYITNQSKIDSLLNAGDTLTIGFGQTAINVSRDVTMRYIGPDIYNRYIRHLFYGGIVKLKLWKRDNNFYHYYTR